MMITRASWIAALALGLLGCDNSPAGGAGAAGKDPRKFDSNGGSYAIELSTSPAVVAVNQPFDVSVTVTPKKGAATDLEVLVDARMPAHFHGMNRTAKVTRRQAGTTCKAEGPVLHMPARWQS